MQGIVSNDLRAFWFIYSAFTIKWELGFLLKPYLCRIYHSHHYLNSFFRNAFITTVNSNGQCFIFRDQEAVHSNVQLPMKKVGLNAVAVTHVDSEPCIAIAGRGDGAGVYLLHAKTMGAVRSLPYKEDVYCVCINATGTKLFFGTWSG